MKYSTLFAAALAAAVLASPATETRADDREMIHANTERALHWLRTSDRDTAKLLDSAAGVLVFPDIVKMGFGAGGEFGEGSLLVDGEIVDYYATAGTTFGMGPESEYKAEVIFFMTEEALQAFRAQRSVKVGEHVTVPLAGSGRDALDADHPHVGMVFSQDGHVTHLEMKGDRITRIVR